jgi:alpha-N-arabinofuranosidase
MIQFQADTAKTVRSTSWYVWSLFAKHVFTKTLPTTSKFGPLYHVAGKNEQTGGHIFKAAVYNSTNGADVPVRLTFEGVREGTNAELTVLTGPKNVYGVNDPNTGVNVVKTKTSNIKADKGGVFQFSLPDMSVAVLDTSPKKPGHWNRAIKRN